ncbi:MAG TPA: carboxypeptidase-like regulatory domain-containing protein [Candidatus Dormibacteraeota bacterium]|nr:carboxypeptidase-like regulatory domain-containing protein [Candidatus Dormibacteraeota bacterium]
MRISQSLSVALILALTAPTALTQSNGAISGQVTDSSKAPVPGVRVLVTAVETGVQRPTTTNGEGLYSVPSLPPGNYIVTAELDGFKKSVSAPLKLDTTATARVDLVLAPQESKVAVEVTAAAPSVQTESSMTGGTISGKELSDLPLQGRNSLELALTVAGVSGEMGADEAGISYNIPSAGSGLTVSGGRAGTSSIMADGANATSIGYGRATVTFSPDTIQEFRVITSTFSAQYGVIGGGVISTVSKGGTDEIHGDAFWFNRNPMFTARTFGQPFPSAMRRNEVGVTLGGPFVIPKLYSGKRKTFFFVSYEAKRRRDETSQLERVPTVAERQGDFRDTWVAPGQTNPLLYQQMACSAGGCNQLQQLYRPDANTEFPLFSANDPAPSRVGHVIPAQFLSPVAQKQLQNVPLPNMPYDFFGNNFLGVSGVTGSDNRWSIKIDHNFSSNHRISARYTDIPNLSDRYKLIRDYFLATSPPADRSVTRQGFISDTYVISSHIVNEFRGSYTYSDYSRTLPGDLKAKNYTRDAFGLPSVTDLATRASSPGWSTLEA